MQLCNELNRLEAGLIHPEDMKYGFPPMCCYILFRERFPRAPNDAFIQNRSGFGPGQGPTFRVLY